MKHDIRKIRTGISLSLTFFSVFPFFKDYWRRLNAFCEQRGVGLSIVPFWWFSADDLISLNARHVIAYQNVWQEQETFCKWLKQIPWNPKSLFKPLFFGFPSHGQEILYWVRNRFPHAMVIDTHDGLVKVCLTHSETIRRHIASNRLLCIDLTCGQSNELLAKKCYAMLKKLIQESPESIRMVIIGTDDPLGLMEFIMPGHGKTTALEEMLKMLSGLVQKNSIPLIVDISPNPEQTIKDVENRIQTIVSAA